MKTLRVEILLAFRDHTWYTEYFDIPRGICDRGDEEIIGYMHEKQLHIIIARERQYPKIVLIAVMSVK